MNLTLDRGTIKVYEMPHQVWGLDLGARMTVIKLENGELFVHSPIRLTPDIRRDLDDFGLVKVVVSPNDFHHLFVKDFMAVYLNAEYIGSPGLRKKRHDLSFSRYFSDEFSPAWKKEIEFFVYRGSETFHEVIFYHLASRTLILTDLAMNFKKTFRPWPFLMTSLMGTNGKFQCSFLVKHFTKNRILARETIHKVSHWPFETIIMSHGEIITSIARQKFLSAFQWL